MQRAAYTSSCEAADRGTVPSALIFTAKGRAFSHAQGCCAHGTIGGDRQDARDHLGELDEELEHVRDALAGDGRGGHNIHILTRVRILPVQCHIQALLIQVQNALLQPLLELGHHVRLLPVERLPDWGVLDALPLKQAVHLAHRNIHSHSAVVLVFAPHLGASIICS